MKAQINTQLIFQVETFFGASKNKSKKMRKKLAKLKVKSDKAKLKNKQSLRKN